MVESSVSSINKSLPSWEIQVNIEVYSATLFSHLEVLMIWLYSRVIVLDLWEEKDSKTDLPEAQGSRHARESKSGIPEIFLLVESGILEILMEEFGILSFGILNPRRRIQNPGLSCITLHGATRWCAHSICPAGETGIHWWLYLFGQRN